MFRNSSSAILGLLKNTAKSRRFSTESVSKSEVLELKQEVQRQKIEIEDIQKILKRNEENSRILKAMLTGACISVAYTLGLDSYFENRRKKHQEKLLKENLPLITERDKIYALRQQELQKSIAETDKLLAEIRSRRGS